MSHSIISAAGIAAAIAMMTTATPAFANADFTGAGQTIDLDCDGKSATIVGANNEMTITGHCQLLSIEGAANRVHVQMAKNGVIRVTGASNEIDWATPDGSKPRLQITGAGNRISKAR